LEEKTMDRREFIAAAGTVAAAATASQAFAQTGEAPMHPPKYKALEEAASHCVATGNDCLRHCLGMYAMKDTSMAGCADAAYQLVVACGALQALAAVNSPHVGAVAKGVEQICKACQTECEKFPNVAECKACGESCKACAAECAKAA
jgi:Cys-rich four helix bundle protein (predicted Tat secretion target)